MFELMENQHDNSAVSKVVGVGGGGGNAVEHMVAENIDGVEFVVKDIYTVKDIFDTIINKHENLLLIKNERDNNLKRLVAGK